MHLIVACVLYYVQLYAIYVNYCVIKIVLLQRISTRIPQIENNGAHGSYFNNNAVLL